MKESRRTVMYQQWRDLLFLHWRFPPDLVQASLPESLRVETFADSAWLGVVPFRMQGIRPAGLPAVTGLSAFPELNLRTYVSGPDGTSGVYFFSLDAGNPLAVWVARTFFHLPYYPADMHFRLDGEQTRYFESHRQNTHPDLECRFAYRPMGEPALAEPGSLNHFLVERYRLFAWQQKRQRLFCGEVSHDPYTLQEVSVLEWDEHLFLLDRISRPERPPDHAIFAAGVDVRIHPLAAVPA